MKKIIVTDIEGKKHEVYNATIVHNVDPERFPANGPAYYVEWWPDGSHDSEIIEISREEFVRL